MPTTSVDGLAVWWDETGAGAPLVLLHPGGADSRAYDANVPGLAERFRVLRFDRRAQGRTPDPGGPITLDQQADDTIAFLEQVVGEPVHLLGHSMGAPIALLVAQRRLDLVERMVLAEGPFHVNGWKAGVLDPLPEDAHQYLGALHAEVSPDGPSHWAKLWPRLDAGHQAAPALGVDELRAIAVPTLLLFGDTDGEVRPEHLHAFHDALPDAQLGIVPGTGHGLLVDKPELCNRLILDFLTEDR